MVHKSKTAVERRVPDQHTPLCANLAEFGKTALHERPPDATALQAGFDRNWAKSIPASGTIADGYRRERNMAYDAAGIFSDKRD